MDDRPRQAGKTTGLYGHRLVRSSGLICVLTRVQLRHARYLPRMWRYYRDVRRETKSIQSLLRVRFLVESPTAFVIMSIWANEEGLIEFGTIAHNHVSAVRKCFRTARRTSDGVEIWSTQWKLYSASNNLNWGPGTWQHDGDKADFAATDGGGSR